MNWIRDWVADEIVLPFIQQVKNRLLNIKVTLTPTTGRITFNNSEGVNTEVTRPLMVDGVTILSPKDARLQLYSSNIGYLVIELPPEFATYTMMSLQLHAFIYRKNSSFKALYSGYTYQVAGGNARWVNVGSRDIAKAKAEFETVRFARKTRAGGDPTDDTHKTKFMLIIGDVDTNWVYGKLALVNCMFSHQGHEVNKWDTGWNMSIVADEDIDWDDVVVDFQKDLN